MLWLALRNLKSAKMPYDTGAAIASVARIGSPAVQSLLDILADKKAGVYVQVKALRSLGRIPDARAVKALQDAVRNPPYHSEFWLDAALESLIGNGHADTQQAIASILESSWSGSQGAHRSLALAL